MIVVVTPEEPTPVTVTPAGPRGPAATIEIGDVVTLPAGDDATVDNSGTSGTAVFDFGIPAGPAPILTFDTTITGAPGSDAAVIVTPGDPGEYELQFTVPRGSTGLAGQNAYLYVAYASDDSGTDFTLTFDDALHYMAFLHSTEPIETPVVGDFAGLWRNTRGPVGPMPTIEAGTVTTGDPGTDADVVITEPTPGNFVIDFTIPRGDASDLDASGITVTPDGYFTGAANVQEALEYLDATIGYSFDMSYMSEGADAKILTAAERGILSTFVTRGTINTLQTVQEIAWSSGAVRWRWTLEADGSLGLRFYDVAGTIISKYGWDQSGFFTTPAGLKIFDASGDALTITLGSTLTANRSFVIRTADANTDITFPTSGHLLSEFKAGAPVTASGTSVAFTNLDCDDVIFKFNKVSHNNGSSTTIRLYYSTDNGSSWSTGFVTLTANIFAVNDIYGAIVLLGLREGTGAIIGGQLSNAATFPGMIVQSTNPFVGVSAGAQINAIKFELAAGSFDDGTITASKRG